MEKLPQVPLARQSIRAICNMCLGLFGVQIVWGLHNVNTSRIFQTFGADIDQLAFLWIAAPAAGLLVQPLIGYLSDRTWGRLGRRRPYMLIGALLSAAVLFAMPHMTSLWAASVMLWLLIAAINIVMEPFRALVADSLPEDQRTLGFAIQVFFIGTGAVFASALPWMLSHWFGVEAQAAAGQLPPAIRVAFYAGAVALLLSVAWTVFTTRESPPAPLSGVALEQASEGGMDPVDPRGWAIWGWGWLGAALLVALTAIFWLDDRELHVLAAIAAGYGVLVLLVVRYRLRGSALPPVLEIVEDVIRMPPVLRRLAVVQFFTWFGLFAIWVFTMPAVAARHFGTLDPASAAYALAADRVGLIFAQYNGVAALAALLLPSLAARIGRRLTYSACLLVGAGGLLGIVGFGDPTLLWLPTLGLGIAWAAVLSLPYAMLADALPAAKRGVYMGIHNIFLVLPQLVAASVLGVVVQTWFGGHTEFALILAAACMVVAAAVALTIPRPR
ncbi:MFS transporter [Sphingomonas sp. LT1P40]|uniref:MFS transporter n=1 Tax=Alteristakelama amylovorans TaxID=3096166 RepID=UPI002FC650E5